MAETDAEERRFRRQKPLDRRHGVFAGGGRIAGTVREHDPVRLERSTVYIAETAERRDDNENKGQCPSQIRPPNSHNGDRTRDDGTRIEPAKRISEAVWLVLCTRKEAETAKRRDEHKNQRRCPSQNDPSDLHGVSFHGITRLVQQVWLEIGKATLRPAL